MPFHRQRAFRSPRRSSVPYFLLLYRRLPLPPLSSGGTDALSGPGQAGSRCGCCPFSRCGSPRPLPALSPASSFVACGIDCDDPAAQFLTALCTVDGFFVAAGFLTGRFLFVFLYGVSRCMFVVGDERSQFVRDFEGISAVARICDIFYKEVSA